MATSRTHNDPTTEQASTETCCTAGSDDAAPCCAGSTQDN